jgi:23S rRNA (cytosine1962-C5)-methyltransferase
VSVRLFQAALGRRERLLAKLESEDTDCYRLFHGIAEGRPGLAVDRYGPILLFQTWREPLEPAEIESIRRVAADALGKDLVPVWNDRAAKQTRSFGGIPEEPLGRELGLVFDVRPRKRGLDPLLFLDLRVGRRLLRSAVRGASLLNLFAYTCSIAVAAASGGAREIWNVDFALSALDAGRRNLELNGIPAAATRNIEEDVIPVVRQLAGLPVRFRRGAVRRRFLPLDPRQFDVVVLDPPRWSKGPFGAVDVVRDYPALFKPALLATARGGRILATNHVPEVSREDWISVLNRTAEKCGRPLGRLEVLGPEEDFPSFDDAPPLKVAWIEV